MNAASIPTLEAPLPLPRRQYLTYRGFPSDSGVTWTGVSSRNAETQGGVDSRVWRWTRHLWVLGCSPEQLRGSLRPRPRRQHDSRKRNQHRPQTLRPVLDRYCITCHNTRLKTAGLALDGFDLERVGHDADTWETRGAQAAHARDAADRDCQDRIRTPMIAPRRSLEAALDAAADGQSQSGSRHRPSAESHGVHECGSRSSRAGYRRAIAAAR